MKGLKVMKKALSLFLALVIAALCLVPAFAQDEQKEMAKYEISEGVYVLPESVTVIKEGDFEGLNAKAVLITAKTIDISQFAGLNDAVIILPDSAMSSAGTDAKYDAAKAAKDWFAYDVFEIFGKTILTLLYNPQIDAQTCAWYDKLIENVRPDFVLFNSLDGEEFYALGSVTGSDIANGTFGRDANPGFFRGLILNFCLSELEAKDTFSKHPGGKSGNFLVSLFRSLFKK